MIHPCWGGQEVDVGSWNDCGDLGKTLRKGREEREREGERKEDEGWGGGREGRGGSSVVL